MHLERLEAGVDLELAWSELGHADLQATATELRERRADESRAAADLFAEAHARERHVDAQ